VEELGVFKYRRVCYNISLGTDGLSGGSDTNYGELTRVIRDIIKLPLEDSNGVELSPNAFNNRLV